MLTTKQILELISDDYGSAGYPGKIEGLRRFAVETQTVNGHTTAPATHRQLLTDLQAASTTRTERPGKYLHPGQDPRADALRRADRNGQTHEFSPTDLAWLNRLPSDPEAVSYEDAVALADLANASSSFKDRSGARLIMSIWAPVKEIHDRRAAEVALQNAKIATPDVPASIVPALAEALAVELPQLTPAEVKNRVQQMITDAVNRRDADRQGQIEDAQSAIDQATEAAELRTRVTKQPESRVA